MKKRYIIPFMLLCAPFLQADEKAEAESKSNEWEKAFRKELKESGYSSSEIEKFVEKERKKRLGEDATKSKPKDVQKTKAKPGVGDRELELPKEGKRLLDSFKKDVTKLSGAHEKKIVKLQADFVKELVKIQKKTIKSLVDKNPNEALDEGLKIREVLGKFETMESHQFFDKPSQLAESLPKELLKEYESFLKDIEKENKSYFSKMISLQETVVEGMKKVEKKVTKSGTLEDALGVRDFLNAYKDLGREDHIVFFKEGVKNVQPSGSLISQFKKEAKKLKVISSGYDHGNRALIQYGSTKVLETSGAEGRGFNVVAIHRGKVLWQKAYDTFDESEASAAMKKDIMALKKGTLVAIAVCDEAASRSTPETTEALKAIGSKTEWSRRFYRHSYYCVGMVGLKEGQAIEDRSDKNELQFSSGKAIKK